MFKNVSLAGATELGQVAQSCYKRQEYSSIKREAGKKTTAYQY